MSLHIDTSSAAFVAYRELAVAPAAVERGPARSDAPEANRPRVPAPRDVVDTRSSRAKASLSTALRSAQEAISANEETGTALGRAHGILHELRVLVSHGLVDGRPPAVTTSEHSYLSLLGELTDLGRGAPVFDLSAPAQLDLQEVARDVKASRGTGLDEALSSVESALRAINDDRRELRRTVNTLAVALENGAATNSRITDADMAREASSLVRAGILGTPHSAVTAQSTTPDEALRLLQR